MLNYHHFLCLFNTLFEPFLASVHLYLGEYNWFYILKISVSYICQGKSPVIVLSFYCACLPYLLDLMHYLAISQWPLALSLLLHTPSDCPSDSPFNICCISCHTQSIASSGALYYSICIFYPFLLIYTVTLLPTMTLCSHISPLCFSSAKVPMKSRLRKGGWFDWQFYLNIVTGNIILICI